MEGRGRAEAEMDLARVLLILISGSRSYNKVKDSQIRQIRLFN